MLSGGDGLLSNFWAGGRKQLLLRLLATQKVEVKLFFFAEFLLWEEARPSRKWGELKYI